MQFEICVVYFFHNRTVTFKFQTPKRFSNLFSNFLFLTVYLFISFDNFVNSYSFVGTFLEPCDVCNGVNGTICTARHCRRYCSDNEGVPERLDRYFSIVIKVLIVCKYSLVNSPSRSILQYFFNTFLERVLNSSFYSFFDKRFAYAFLGHSFASRKSTTPNISSGSTPDFTKNLLYCKLSNSLQCSVGHYFQSADRGAAIFVHIVGF